jgi:hypothetical protein
LKEEITLKKRIIIIASALAVFGGIAVAAYAAYDVGGSSPPSGFTSGTAVDLAVDPDEADLNNILPGEMKTMDVYITNNNPVPVKVTGLTATFNDGGACAFTVTNVNSYWYPLAAWATASDALNVAMGDAALTCEGNAGLQVTATATGTMP